MLSILCSILPFISLQVCLEGNVRLGKQEILQTTVEGKNCLYEVYGRFSSKTCEQNYYLRRLKMLFIASPQWWSDGKIHYHCLMLIIKGIKPSSLLSTDEDHQDHYKKERRMEKRRKRKGKRKGKRRNKRAKRKKTLADKDGEWRREDASMEGEEGEKVDKEEIKEINAKGEKEKRRKKN